ncbi:MAG: hypothetical protein VR69_02785 [Peptococcaceae bacterium BRH_c4b]|nr:MAG: hypothetical protein VR69_02785 [Peptococcaceae bacterium BRH_c4b]
MIRRVLKFFGLSWREQWLFIEAFSLTGVVRLAILLLPFRWLAPLLGKHMRESPVKEDVAKLEAARWFGRVVETVSRYTPWESKCLVQAIAGKIILRRRGITNTLYLGVGRDEGSGLIAHAWLRCGGTIITGGHGQKRFIIVGKFSDDGGYKESK